MNQLLHVVLQLYRTNKNTTTGGIIFRSVLECADTPRVKHIYFIIIIN